MASGGRLRKRRVPHRCECQRRCGHRPREAGGCEAGPHDAVAAVIPSSGRRVATSTLARGYADALNRQLTMKDTPPPGIACYPPPDEVQDLRPVEGSEADEELASLAKALGHPARVRIMRLLVRRRTCICGDIVDSLDLAQSTVSQHLKVLKDSGLIRGEVQGPRVCYCVEPRALRRVRALLWSL